MVAISVYDDPKTEVYVHTLGTNCWRRIQEFPYGVPIGDESGKFVGGALNWVVRENPKKLFVVSLDLENESYQEILQPDYGEVKLIGLTLGEYRDCLCIFAHSSKLIVDVWIMKEYGKKDSWNKLFTIPHIEDLGRPTVNFSPCITVAFIYEDEQVLLVSRDIFEPKLVVYDSRSDTFKISKFENIKGRDPTIYIESLITTC
ncbi:unnamed protein product [Trifolium pratense]|uniref:Uncharacterized protein n=1 Tax=Trifolium pratense TaxID=57577 RepID=A0ACB0J2H5_TRIPR|nr:unnamed protein product [Trifolium pratense]